MLFKVVSHNLVGAGETATNSPKTFCARGPLCDRWSEGKEVQISHICGGSQTLGESNRRRAA